MPLRDPPRGRHRRALDVDWRAYEGTGVNVNNTFRRLSVNGRVVVGLASAVLRRGGRTVSGLPILVEDTVDSNTIYGR